MKNQKKINGIQKVYLKYDFIGGSVINGQTERILSSCCPDQLHAHKKYKNRNNKNQKKVIKPQNKGLAIYFVNDKNKTADFNGQTITFILQLKN